MVTRVCCHGFGMLCLAQSLLMTPQPGGAVGRAIPSQSPGMGFFSTKGLS